MHVLIAGVSIRAATESAARAGFAVTAIDAFADLDVHPAVRMLPPPSRFTPAAAVRAVRNVASDAAVYLAGFENHPRAVSALAAGRALWGNPPAELRRVRDPVLAAAAFRRHGLAAPSVFRRIEAPGPLDAEERWLVKPVGAGGGHGVRPWAGEAPPRHCYLQERVEGTPGSVVFVAAGGRARPLGVSRQLIGDPAFGASGYRYCGSILAAAGDRQFADDRRLAVAAGALAAAAAQAFGLVGVNGIDFVARAGAPQPVEVNPRWCASMELVESAYGLSVFAAHAAACAEGVLPEFDLLAARRRPGAFGKAVVFARRDVTVGDTRRWLEHADIRDVPRPGARIRAGRPVCTVFAAGPDGAACHAALARRAGQVYADLARWERPARRPRAGARRATMRRFPGRKAWSGVRGEESFPA